MRDTLTFMHFCFGMGRYAVCYFYEEKNANCTHEHVNESFHFQVPCTFVLELDAMLFVMLIAHMNMSCEWIVIITLLNSDSNSLFQDYIDS